LIFGVSPKEKIGLKKVVLPRSFCLSSESLFFVLEGDLIMSNGWIWIVIIVVLVLLIAWWGYRSSKQASAQSGTQPEVRDSHDRYANIQINPDDLAIIEGIGPRIAEVLNSAGITTFAQLAQTSPARLEEILKAANLRLADPTSWPEQAQLAASGDMQGLQALQDRLKGGRHQASA
jgi:predicted flap endonuclease-1-like 5' DNA nuclease